MILETYKAKRKNKNKYDKRVKLRCDKCGKDFDVFYYSFLKGEERHPNLHLCRICANSSEYKPKYIGKNNKKFKGGISQNGYRRIYYKGKNRAEHRVIAEIKIGRKLNSTDIVHHIDCQKLNNSEDNLFIFNGRSEHRKCHSAMEELGLSLLNKMIWFDAKDGIYKTEECSDFDPINLYGNVVSNTDFSVFVSQDTDLENRKRHLCKKGTNRVLHLFIIEEVIGRKLFRDEVVHHIDGNKFNNDISNLYLTNRSCHKKMHESLSSCVGELYRNNIVGFDIDKGSYYLV